MNNIFNKYKLVPLDGLHKASWNYKEDDIVMSEKLRRNILNNGQIENLIIAKIDGSDKYTVLNGNHRIDTLRELDITSAVCADLGNISLAKAQRIAIETNETKFPVDTFKLSVLMQGIASEYSIEDLEATMPYSGDELQFFINNTLDNTPELPETTVDDLDGLDNDKKDMNGKKCPNCGFTL